MSRTLRSQVVTLNVVYSEQGAAAAPELWDWDLIIRERMAETGGGGAIEVLAAGPVKVHRNDEERSRP